MLVSEVMTRIRNILGDATGSRWPDSRIIGLIDEAQKDISRKSLILKDSINILLHTSQSNYTLPSNVYRITRATYLDKAMSISSSGSMDLYDSTWIVTEGEPTTLVYDNINKGIIRINPIPNFTEPEIFDITTNPYVTIYYVKTPNTLTLATDELEIPDDYVVLIEYYVSGRLFREDFDTQNRTFGGEQLMLYSAGIKDVLKEVSKDFLGISTAYTVPYRKGV